MTRQRVGTGNARPGRTVYGSARDAELHTGSALIRKVASMRAPFFESLDIPSIRQLLGRVGVRAMRASSAPRQRADESSTMLGSTIPRNSLSFAPLAREKPGARVKKLYQRYPTRREIKALYRRLAIAWGVPIPAVRFMRSIQASTNAKNIMIVAPDVYGIHDEDPLPYWITLYHELAHWIAFYTGSPEIDHAPRMFEIMLAICLEEGLPMDRVWEEEMGYKPGSLKRAARSIGHTIRSRERRYREEDQLATPVEESAVEAVASRTAASPARPRTSSH